MSAYDDSISKSANGDKPNSQRTATFANVSDRRHLPGLGRAFLTPPRAVSQKFQKLLAGSDRLTRRHVIVLAHFFVVSREVIVRRLLSLIKTGTWDWFHFEWRHHR